MEYFITLVLVGIVFAAFIYGVFSWMRSKDIKPNWYEWLIGTAGFALFILSVQHLFGAMEELFPYAAWMGFAIMGIPALILMLIAWQLVSRRAK